MKEMTLSCIEQATGGTLHIGFRTEEGCFREAAASEGDSAVDGTALEKAAKLRETEVSGIVTDSRRAEEGSCFCAIVGARSDGHSFIPKVFSQGALCVLSERDLTEKDLFSGPSGGGEEWRAWIVVPSTEEALGRIAARYLEALKVPVVGITGSVGKTSTKEMIASVLGTHYRTLKTEGNFNNALGLPLTVFRLTEKDEIAVLEMGISHFGDMKVLGEIARPDTAVITNIGNCHLEFLGDRDGVLKEKSSIFRYLKDGGHGVLNGNDDRLRRIRVTADPACFPADPDGKKSSRTGTREQESAGVLCVSGLWFGIRSDELPPEGIGAGAPVEYPGDLDPECCVTADRIRTDGFRGSFCVIHTPAGSFEVKVPVPGLVNVQNAAAAAAAGLLHGLSLGEIRRGIEGMKTIPGRFRIIESKGTVVIDDCYNANPMSMKSSLSVLKESSGRRVAILGDMGELGKDEVLLHQQTGEAAARCADRLIAVGSLSRSLMEAAVRKNPALSAVWYESVDALLPHLPEEIREGDVILVKASHFMQFGRIVDVLTE